MESKWHLAVEREEPVVVRAWLGEEVALPHLRTFKPHVVQLLHPLSLHFLHGHLVEFMRQAQVVVLILVFFNFSLKFVNFRV